MRLERIYITKLSISINSLIRQFTNKVTLSSKLSIKRGILLLVFVILFMHFTRAYVGLTPAAYSIDFQPNLKQVFNFNFYSDDPEIKFNISVSGDFAQYVELNRDELSGSGNVNVLLKLPKNVEKPGVHRIYIAATQLPKPGQGTLGIVASLRGIIDVRVPYPGKYAEMEFSATNANAGEPVNFKLKIYSRGDEDIVTASYVEIYNSQNKKIDGITLGINEIKSRENVEINKEVDTKNYPAGKYKAIAIVQYYDKEVKAEAPFRLGELFVDIADYKKEFEKNKINPITIDVESFWNDPIENVYAEVSILGYENLIPAFKTPSVSLGSFERKTLEGFFNSASIQENKFQAKIVLYYLDKTTEKIVDLRFKREINYVLIGAIAGAVLLVIIILFLIFWIRKLKKTVKRR